MSLSTWRRRHLRLPGIVLGILGLLVVFPSFAVSRVSFAYHRGEVGEAPSTSDPICTAGLRPCTSPVVLAKGAGTMHRFELVGLRSKKLGLCFGVATVHRLVSLECSKQMSTRLIEPQLLATGSLNGIGPPVTLVAGTTDGSVAGVRLRYRNRSGPKKLTPIFNRLSAPLLRSVRAEAPFGVFIAEIRSCVDFRRIRLSAFDEGGTLLKTTRAVTASAPNLCR